MSKLHGTTAQQSMPLWDRNKNDRGHLSSVDKAVNAHRQRVSERLGRAEKRMAAALEINQKFFPKPTNVDVVTSSREASAAPMEMDTYQNYQQDYIDGPAGTEYNQVQDIYEEINMSPVRDHAVAVLDKDVEGINQQQVDEDVPKGSYIDYTV